MIIVNRVIDSINYIVDQGCSLSMIIQILIALDLFLINLANLRLSILM